MPNSAVIPSELHFIWLGSPLPKKYLTTLLELIPILAGCGSGKDCNDILAALPEHPILGITIEECQKQAQPLKKGQLETIASTLLCLFLGLRIFCFKFYLILIN